MRPRLFIFTFLLIQLSAFSQPSPRASAHLFYMHRSNSLVLLDGYEKGTFPASGKSETWSWKDNKWTLVGEMDQPLRSLSAAAYVKGRVFLFGGVGSKGYDDTLKKAHLFNSVEWMDIRDDQVIGTRDHHEMVYEASTNRAIIYGGQNSKREFDTKTWTFTLGKWSMLDIPGPGPRIHHAMAYDPIRNRTVLYGGSGTNTSLDETWEFDGTKWMKIDAPINPGKRAHHAMVYDSARNRVLLYGGQIDMKPQGDIWAWDGKTWEKLSDNGPARILPAVAYNPSNGNLYVYGGNGGDQMLSIYSDLWQWDGTGWVQLWKGKEFRFDAGKDMYVEK